MKIFINNEEVVCDKNIIITEEILSTSSVILNNCYPKSWETNKDYTGFWFPKDYSQCKIYDNDNNLKFSGIVKNTGNINLSPFQPHFLDLQVLDYKTFLSECDTLDYVIENKNVSQAITELVSKIADYGFVVGNIKINNDTKIGAYSTFEQTPYDIFEYFSEITQTRWFARTIDENTVAIDFYSIERLPMGNDLVYSRDFFKTNNIVDIQYNYSSNDYRNKQIITSGEVLADIDYNEVYEYNNSNIETTTPIGKINSIESGDTTYIVGTKIDKKNGRYADFYYSYGSNKIEVNATIPSGTLLTINYTPIVVGRQVSYNQNEMSRISGLINRTSGVISRYENRNDTTSSNELFQIGQTYLKYKGSSAITLSVRTENNDLWNIGQQVHFVCDELTELDKLYLVKTKTTERIIVGSEEYIFYNYELVSNYDDENAINYFDNQRRKLLGNIEEGNYIDRNVDLPSTTNLIFCDLEIEVVNDGNILDAVLDAPFNV